jgi:hypothetical protein
MHSLMHSDLLRAFSLFRGSARQGEAGRRTRPRERLVNVGVARCLGLFFLYVYATNLSIRTLAVALARARVHTDTNTHKHVCVCVCECVCQRPRIERRALTTGTLSRR